MLFFVEKPCVQNMKDGGLVPKKDIHVTGTDTTVLHVTIPSSDKHDAPEWVSLKVVVENVKTVKATPVGKDGKPSGEPEIVHVTRSTTTTVAVTFTHAVKAESITVELTKATTTAPVKSDVTSAKACLEKNGTFMSTCC
jgi:hypothetical protein